MFLPATLAWFDEAFAAPTEVQRRGWEAIGRGRHALLVAPTGSGKTLAAFLAGIDQCLRLPPDAAEGVRVLYVSPLKALVYDGATCAHPSWVSGRRQRGGASTCGRWPWTCAPATRPSPPDAAS